MTGIFDEPHDVLNGTIETLHPPQAIDAERAVLGAIMKDRESIELALEVLDSGRRFYLDQHRLIFEAASDIHNRAEPCDITTISEELVKKGHLERCGNRTYLVDLAESVASTANIKAHARLVLDKSILRNTISAANVISKTCYSPDGSTEEILGQVEQLTADLSEQTKQKDSKGVIHLGRYLPEIIEWAKGIETGHVSAGLQTGFDGIDKLLGGLQKQTLIIIGGRPSMGKTAMMNCIATNIVREGTPALVFSAETGAHSFAARSLCTLSGVDSMALRRGRLSSDDWDKLSYGQSKMAEWPYFLDDTHEIDINQLCMRAKRLREKENIGVIFVDFIQKISTRARFADYRHEIGSFARRFKRLASELEIPVVVGCQFSRNVDGRKSKVPVLSDLKEAGKIEEEADVVIGMHRPEIYATPKQLVAEKFAGEAYAYIMKHRDGPIGEVRLYFQKTLARFENSQPAFGYDEF